MSDLVTTNIDPVPAIAGQAAVVATNRVRPNAAHHGPVAWVRAKPVRLGGVVHRDHHLCHPDRPRGDPVLRLGHPARGMVGAGRRQWPTGHHRLPGRPRRRCLLGRDQREIPLHPVRPRYPFELQWRPGIVNLLFIGLYAISAWRRFWRKELLLIWVGTLTLIGVLMWGGVAGLTYVPQDQWGGLPLTLILATFGLAFAFPLAVAVALGRRSRHLPAVRALCVLYVELIRGVPLITLLFMASVMFPLFLPDGVNIDKLLRAQVAIILFAGAYLAEVVRGGLQALPKGQYEAADALGLSYWKKTGLIVLPQALRLVIPPLVNTFIGFFKDTSLVLIIGLFDLLSAGKVAISEPAWAAYSTEVYLALAAVYFVFCYTMARYSRGLEHEFARSRNR